MKYDYKKAELYYTRHKGATVKSCSERYKIPLYSLRKKATADGWVEKKRKYWENVTNKSKDKSAEHDSDKLASVARASAEAAKILEEALNDPEQFYKYLISISDSEGASDTVERKYSKLDTKSMRDVVSALKDLVSVIRNVDNLPTEGEKLARKIQRERWNLEKKEKEAQKESRNSDIIVSFEDETEEMSG